ncbi:hypothetical protein KR018_011261 [Drosophila ironensis]|nr:hypothetical protein KR018_011261 [Drosophila ironensis]
MIAQVTLRNVVGSKTLNVLLTSRQALSREIQESVAGITSRWGVLVERVDLMDIILPPTLERSLASEAEAVREARAKIILAEGELSASKALKEASDVMSENQITLQLRHLQILSSIATERRVRIIYPIPMEVMEPFMKNGGGESGGGESGGRAGGGGGQGTMASECAGTSGAASETIGEEVVTSGSGRDGAGVSSADAGVFMSMSKHILPQTPIVEANDRPHYVAVEMEPSRQHYVPYVFPPPETSRPPRSTSEPPASRGRLAFMDLQSYRDFLHTRWQ